MLPIAQDLSRLSPDTAKHMLELTPAGYCVLDRDFRIRYANGHFCRLVGVPPAAMRGAMCYDVLHHGRPCPKCAVRKVWEEELPLNMSVRKDVRADGKYHFLDKRVVPIFGRDGRMEYSLSVFIDRTRQMRRQRMSDAAFRNLVRSLVSILERKDPYTYEHSANVGAIAARLAKFMGLPDDEAYRIYAGALLHDIGISAVPERVMHKPGRLSEDEFTNVKLHPRESARLLGNLRGQGFADVRDVCLHHHERWDGTGYPDGLKGAQIPLGSQIVALADAYDAMTSDRAYRPAMPHKEAVKRITEAIGTQFAPQAGSRFVEMATLYFNGREQMVASEVTSVTAYVRYLAGDVPGVEEKSIGPKDGLAGLPGGPAPWHGGGMPVSDDLAMALLEAAPAHYAIYKPDMSIAYVSESILRATGHAAEELIGQKCHALAEKGGRCLMDTDGLMCAGLRALYNGKAERYEVDEVWAGVPRSFEGWALPLEVGDERCILEAMVDRTSEVTTRRLLAEDCRAIIRTLQDLIGRFNPEGSAKSRDVVGKYDTDGDYFSLAGGVGA